MNTEDIKRKLRGILAKTQDGSGTTEQEANAALLYARRLMLRHNLTDEDITAKERSPHEIAADTEYSQDNAFSMSKSLPVWQGYLANIVCEIIGTVSAYKAGTVTKRTASGAVEFNKKGQPVKRAAIKFYGPQDHVRDAIELFEEWSILISSVARLSFGSVTAGDGRGYCIGFTTGMYTTIRDMKRKEQTLIDSAPTMQIGMADAATAAQSETGDSCSALVVIKSTEVMLAKKNRAEEWLKEQGVHVSGSAPRARRGNYSQESFSSGFQDGKKANISHTPTKKIS